MEVEIANGQNVIQLLYDEFASCLVIENALTVNWPDCAGSVGEYYSVSNYSSKKRKELTENLNQVLIYGNKTEIFDSIKNFLTLFSNGKYYVNLTDIKIDKTCFHHEGIGKYSDTVPENQRFTGFYPYPSDHDDYFFTIPNNSIDFERVEFYKSLIQSGLKPKVIAYELHIKENLKYTSCYILDGHHKAKAYIDLGIDIPTVKIVKEAFSKTNTREILLASSKILKDFEFDHLFLENDENSEELNLLQDKWLTNKLDEILNRNAWLGTWVTKLFVRLDKSTDQMSIDWLTARLKILSKNKTIGTGLKLRSGLSYNFVEINNKEDLINWIKDTLPNNSYSIEAKDKKLSVSFRNINHSMLNSLTRNQVHDKDLTVVKGSPSYNFTRLEQRFLDELERYYRYYGNEWTLDDFSNRIKNNKQKLEKVLIYLSDKGIVSLEKGEKYSFKILKLPDLT